MKAILSGLAARLEDARAALLKDARPAPAVVAAAGRALTEAAGALRRAEDEAGEERLEVLRLALDVRARMRVVERLLEGSAWFASLARELAGDGARKGLYGPGTDATSSGYERKI